MKDALKPLRENFIANKEEPILVYIYENKVLLKAIFYPANGSNRLSPVLLFVFTCIVGTATIYFHEMWRDESQAFLLVRDSKNLVDLWNDVRYEGHPFLWHLILFIAYHLWSSIYTIQVLHLLIGLLVIALIIFYSPFSFIEKVLLCFSYYFSFEYLVISRNYSIGNLLLFLAIVTYNKNRSKGCIIALAIILGLCANSNIYALIISCCLFIYFLSKSFRSQVSKVYKNSILYSAVIFSFFVIVALLQIIPPADRTPKLSIAKGISLAKAGKLSKETSESLFYMPDPLRKQEYWGSNIFESKPFSNSFSNKLFFSFPQLLTLALFVLLIFSLTKTPSILLLFAGSVISILAFTAFIFDKGLLRHTGNLFVLLVTVVWLYRISSAVTGIADVYFSYLFKTMLAMQFAASIFVHIAEIKYPFSGAKDAALFLVKSHRNNESIILHPDFEGIALLHYAGIKQVYYATIKGKGSFIKFNDKRKAVSYADVYAMAMREQIETMVLNGKKDDSLMNKIGYQLLYKPATASAVCDEDFYIYGKKQQQ